MQGHQQRWRQSSSDSDSGVNDDDEEEGNGAKEESAMALCRMKCKEGYNNKYIDMCYEEAYETKEEIKHEIDDLKSKVNLLRLLSVRREPNSIIRTNTPCFFDVVLVASGSTEPSFQQKTDKK